MGMGEEVVRVEESVRGWRGAMVRVSLLLATGKQQAHPLAAGSTLQNAVHWKRNGREGKQSGWAAAA